MIERCCPVCSTHYLADPIRLRHGRQTTCSRKCSYELRNADKRNSSEFECATCRTKFSRSPSQTRKAKYGSLFCSRKCHYRGRGLGHTKRIVANKYVMVKPWDPARSARLWTTRRANGTDKHTEAAKEKMRLSTARRIAEGKIPAVSLLEGVVADQLRHLRVSFARQMPIRDPNTGCFCALVDFQLDANTVLEVNGTFWHADIRFFPNGTVHPAQVRTAQRYARKSTKLGELGITIIEVWEQDVKANALSAVRDALIKGGYFPLRS